MSQSLETSTIEFTKKDLIKQIKLPTQLTPELAYDIGVHIADGCMNAYPAKTGIDYYYKCSGNPETEKEWYDKILYPIKKKLFNYCPEPKDLSDGTYGFEFRSKAILSFYSKVIGLPLGKKSEIIQIPPIILANQKLSLFCLRGIFDADGHVTFKRRYKQLHYYPFVGIGTKSKTLNQQIKLILDSLNIKNTACLSTGYDPHVGKNYFIYLTLIPGKKRFVQFREKIGFRVPNDLAKISIWEKFGFCPPNITYAERMKILSGEKDPIEHYGQGRI